MIARPPATDPVLTRWPVIVRDWLGSDTLRSMSAEAEALFLRLCLDQWEHGFACADRERWCRAHAHRMRDFDSAWAQACAPFANTEQGLVHPRVARDRSEQIEAVRVRQEMGSKAATARWEGRSGAKRKRGQSASMRAACGPNHSASASVSDPVPDALLSDRLRTPELRRALGDYQRSRKEQGHKALGEVGMKRLIAKLEGWGHDRAVAALNDSAANGYQGVFEPKGSRSAPAARPDGLAALRQRLNGSARTVTAEPLGGKP